ncbi:zinc-ribbon domain-containing protein [Saccharopolyspora sp. SCSIO 74807]|uniref:zinc-ribbon domain-containing protein n=1 Tax=Saccharopolyspora sp. SCSIO 74807 TaxID=3118084 RepID=UPI0030D1EA07
MFILFGFRRTARRLGVLLLVCHACGGQYAAVLDRVVTKFTVFFIPLFPVRVRRTLTCTRCARTATISKAEAARLLRESPRA